MTTASAATGSPGALPSSPNHILHYLPTAPVDPNATMPSGWRIDTDAVLYRETEGSRGKGSAETEASGKGSGKTLEPVGPVVLVTSEDEKKDGRISCGVAFAKGRGWKVIPVGAEVLAGGGILKKLSAYGLDVDITKENDKAYSDFVKAYRRQNHSVIPHRRCLGSTGWVTPANFALGTEVFGPQADTFVIQPEGEGDEEALSHFHEKGSFDEWKRVVRSLPDDAVAWVALYAVFSPLLYKFPGGTDTFFFEFAGDTSIGKTTALKFAASAFGYPGGDGEHGLIRSWKNTDLALEIYAALTTNLPQFLDELSVKRLAEVEPVVYMLANAQGKGRGSGRGLRLPKSWLSVIVSSGEASLVECSQKGGIRARVLSVTDPPFGEGEHVADLVANIRRICSENYGHAAREMVKYLVGQDENGRKRMRAIYDQYHRNFRKSACTNLQDRAASYFARIAMAGRLCDVLFGFGDHWRRVWAFWERQKVQLVEEAPTAQRAYDMIVDWYLEHQKHFDHPEGELAESKKYGAVVCDETGQRSLIVLPHRLDKVLRGAGLSPRVAMGELKAKRLLIWDGDDRLTHNVKIFGTRTRCYHIRLPAQDGEKEQDVPAADKQSQDADSRSPKLDL